MHSLKVNNLKSAIDFIANFDQHEMFFPLTPKLIGFVSKNSQPITSSSLDWQVPAKNVHHGFHIRTCSRTISKNKI